MIKYLIDKDTFYDAFNTYCKDLYSEELLIKSFAKILDKLNISYPKECIIDDYSDET